MLSAIKYILIGALMGSAFALYPAGSMVFSLFALSALLIFKNVCSQSRVFLVAIFIIGFTLRAAVSFVNYNGSLAAGIGSDSQPDARVYNHNAFYMADLAKGLNRELETKRDPVLKRGLEAATSTYGGEIPHIPSYQNCFYVWFVGTAYSFFGYAPVAMKMLNGLFGCLLAILTYYMARELFRSEFIAKASAFFIMFLPSMMLWSSSLLKDALANLLFLSYMYFIVKAIMNDRPRYIIYSFLSLVVLSALKDKLIILFFAGFGAALIVYWVTRIKRSGAFAKLAILAAALIAVIALIILNLDNILYFLRIGATRAVSIQRYGAVYSSAFAYQLYAPSTYGVSHNYQQLFYGAFFNLGLAASAVRAFVYYFLSPFPWHVPYGHAALFLFYPQAVLAMIALPFSIFGILVSLRRNFAAIFAILISVFIILAPQMMMESTIGTVIRHRDMFMPLVVAFSLYGIFTAFINTEKHV